MELKLLETSEQNLKMQRNFVLAICVVLLAANIILSAKILLSDRQIILVPPNVGQWVSLTDKQLSPAYLEEMSVYFLSKLLDITSDNINYQSDIVLRHTSPSYHLQMSEFFAGEKKKYAEYNLTTYFIAKSLKIDGLNVTATGTLLSQFATRGKREEEVTYRISYDYKGGVLTIANFEIIKEAKND